jgi:hypothetical protein
MGPDPNFLNVVLCDERYSTGASNSAASKVCPSLSVISTRQPSLAQTRAFAIAINSLVRSQLCVSFSLTATIR